MARFKLGETVTVRPNGGEPVTGKITFIRIETYNPGGGLPDVVKEYYTIVGSGHKIKVREYEILTD